MTDVFLWSAKHEKSGLNYIASPADILRRASRVRSPQGTRDARLRMSAGEAINYIAGDDKKRASLSYSRSRKGLESKQCIVGLCVNLNRLVRMTPQTRNILIP